MCDVLYEAIQELIFQLRSLRSTSASRAVLHNYLKEKHPVLACPGAGLASVEGSNIRIVYHLPICNEADLAELAPEQVTEARDRAELDYLRLRDDLEGAARLYRRLRAELAAAIDATLPEPGPVDAEDKPQ